MSNSANGAAAAGLFTAATSDFALSTLERAGEDIIDSGKELVSEFLSNTKAEEGNGTSSSALVDGEAAPSKESVSGTPDIHNSSNEDDYDDDFDSQVNEQPDIDDVVDVGIDGVEDQEYLDESESQVHLNDESPMRNGSNQSDMIVSHVDGVRARSSSEVQGPDTDTLKSSLLVPDASKAPLSHPSEERDISSLTPVQDTETEADIRRKIAETKEQTEVLRQTSMKKASRSLELSATLKKLCRKNRQKIKKAQDLSRALDALLHELMPQSQLGTVKLLRNISPQQQKIHIRRQIENINRHIEINQQQAKAISRTIGKSSIPECLRLEDDLRQSRTELENLQNLLQQTYRNVRLREKEIEFQKRNQHKRKPEFFKTREELQASLIQLNAREERAKDAQKRLSNTRKRKEELANEMNRLRRLIDENHL